MCALWKIHSSTFLWSHMKYHFKLSCENKRWNTFNFIIFREMENAIPFRSESPQAMKSTDMKKYYNLVVFDLNSGKVELLVYFKDIYSKHVPWKHIIQYRINHNPITIIGSIYELSSLVPKYLDMYSYFNRELCITHMYVLIIDREAFVDIVSVASLG